MSRLDRIRRRFRHTFDLVTAEPLAVMCAQQSNGTWCGTAAEAWTWPVRDPEELLQGGLHEGERVGLVTDWDAYAVEGRLLYEVALDVDWVPPQPCRTQPGSPESLSAEVAPDAVQHVEAVRRCIGQLSENCAGEFRSSHPGERFCRPCREHARKNNIHEGPAGAIGEDELISEFGVITRDPDRD